MARERLYLFDTTLRDGAPFFSLPRLRGRVDRGSDADGVGALRTCATAQRLPPTPTARRAAVRPRPASGER